MTTPIFRILTCKVYWWISETLKNGTSFSALGINADNCNTLMLEMRSQGSEILDTEAVRTLIDRAKSSELRLIALISCLVTGSMPWSISRTH